MTFVFVTCIQTLRKIAHPFIFYLCGDSLKFTRSLNIIIFPLLSHFPEKMSISPKQKPISFLFCYVFIPWLTMPILLHIMTAKLVVKCLRSHSLRDPEIAHLSANLERARFSRRPIHFIRGFPHSNRKKSMLRKSCVSSISRLPLLANPAWCLRSMRWFLFVIRSGARNVPVHVKNRQKIHESLPTRILICFIAALLSCTQVFFFEA